MVAQFPPEIMCKIFNMAVPPAGFDNFPKRLRRLRYFSLVCRAWREPAQRLLFLYPTMEMITPFDQVVDRFLQDLKASDYRYLPKHFRVKGCPTADPKDHPGLPIVGQGHMATNLTALSLNMVQVEPYAFLYFTALRSLSLRQVDFEDCEMDRRYRFPPSRNLSTLTDLTLVSIKQSLPACLLPHRLPSLKALSIHSSDFGDYTSHGTCHNCFRDFNAQYVFNDIAYLLPQLELFSCSTQDWIYSRSRISLIASKTLFDLSSEKPYRGFDALSVKHLRVSSAVAWTFKQIQRLVEEKYPKLETLVAPESWEQFKVFDQVQELMEKKGVALLLDERDAEEEEDRENYICEVFREHLRGVVAKA